MPGEAREKCQSTIASKWYAKMRVGGSSYTRTDSYASIFLLATVRIALANHGDATYTPGPPTNSPKKAFPHDFSRENGLSSPRIVQPPYSAKARQQWQRRHAQQYCGSYLSITISTSAESCGYSIPLWSFHPAATKILDIPILYLTAGQ